MHSLGQTSSIECKNICDDILKAKELSRELVNRELIVRLVLADTKFSDLVFQLDFLINSMEELKSESLLSKGPNLFISAFSILGKLQNLIKIKRNEASEEYANVESLEFAIAISIIDNLKEKLTDIHDDIEDEISGVNDSIRKDLF